jgi:hypothetical protein
MKNFRIGQKVVYRQCGELSNAACLCVLPKDNEVVTIARKCWLYPDSWDLVEYPVGIDGLAQSFPGAWLFPLVSDSVLSEELASISEPVTV